MNMRIALIAAGAALSLAACTTGTGVPRTRLVATLTGLQEVPGPGDADGTGTAEFRVDPNDGQICWNLYVRQIDAATAAHIHGGGAGTAGPVTVTLATPGADGHSEGCAAVDPALARRIALQAHEYYVNVHSAAFPNGAVRGQLRGGPTSRPRSAG